MQAAEKRLALIRACDEMPERYEPRFDKTRTSKLANMKRKNILGQAIKKRKMVGKDKDKEAEFCDRAEESDDDETMENAKSKESKEQGEAHASAEEDKVMEPGSQEQSETKAEEQDDKQSPFNGIDADLQRYFPGITSDTKLCTMCGSSKHMREECSERLCEFCPGLHGSWRCPSRRRCTNCHQLGHPATNCQNSKASAPEVTECARCASPTHLETSCPSLLRTYDPDESRIRKVRFIPSFCVGCGAEGHYEPECRLRSRGPDELYAGVWTQANLSLYIDAESTEQAIAFEMPAGAVLNTRVVDEGFSLDGRSIVPQRHEFIDDDDDDGDAGEPFLRPAVARRPRGGRGQITFGRGRGSGGFSNLAHRGPVRHQPGGRGGRGSGGSKPQRESSHAYRRGYRSRHE